MLFTNVIVVIAIIILTTLHLDNRETPSAGELH